MNEEELKATLKRYNERFQVHGYSPESLGWGKKDRANLRFEILCSYWDLNNKSILDIGCGFGDLYGFLLKKSVKNFKYTGADINPNFIEEGKKLYPGATLLNEDIITNGCKDSFDIVLCSGIFNHQLEDNAGFIKKSFNRFNELSKLGFASNFLSDKVDFKYDYTYHSDPSEILKLAYNYSKRVVLRNDYMPYEFTVFVDKNEDINKELTVYKSFESFV